MLSVPQHILELAERGVVVSVATRDAELFPRSMTGLGVRFADGGRTLAVFVAEKWTAPTLANALGNGRVAVTFSSPITFQTAQVKGLYRDHRPLTADELAYQREWQARLRQELLSAGDSRDSVVALKLDATHSMLLDVHDVFVQTPGPRAGERAK